ncbi:possible cell surface hydrolase [Secundilactobacillus oryzae JCM 18671]|uniref:Possible cell surface hydrolase n=1 Tax=Secundilactobacillus oryzae JCM 18671 TaxID=1291743 RepID=A0A081BG82_9LACO|nr:alpha/beta hydrolase [Secundilactobacillus oryzae]GAK47050.1 possible cell surface hydrolase [Secundilactobacillus oryzae JCM 18671]
MKRKIWAWIAVIVIVAAIVLGITTIHVRNERLRRLYTYSHTLFVHGWTGSIKSEERMVHAAAKSGAAKKRLVIHVKANGKLKYKGHYFRGTKNPMIEVVFDNNRAGEFKDAHWIRKVVKSLKARYGITKFNAVGHSMGSYALLYYTLLYGKNRNLPRPNKLVLIAGPYDGIINNHKLNQPTDLPLSKLWTDMPNQNKLLKNGRPKIIHSEYRMLLNLRKQIPRGVKILNIYGDLENGSNSDGVVTITSARSLGFIVRGRVAKYKELKVDGEHAQHSSLHEDNFIVNRALINFLWAK